ncbi:protein phosphatase PTC7 homolog [Ylistrum balloti]|uniref:protein phosphatase PTC7 homolog n=1 Tax=Ylistrum balloti TaxID=509963 RepID=UPI0029059136|nr:protein phosphatase PTC7 homolog [Ylistrum balloti]
MQSLALYGRFFSRAFVSSLGLNPERQIKARKDFHLVTGSAGFSKSLRKTQGPKQWTYGDDAYFITRNKLADVIGVADGVGGWRNYGVDPSAFPKTLMTTCERMVKEGRFNPRTPVKIIQASYEEMQHQKIPLVGSSTACVVSLHREEHTIYTANLGDSGFLVIRDSEVIHRSVEQQHYFNTPFQLAVVPPSQEGQVLSDSPTMADSTSFKVEEGDILLLGTDGLFDNMCEDMIVDHISKLKDHRTDIQKTANNMVEDALSLSLDQDYLSPFALSSIDAGINLKGGKPDDITVILARVAVLDT